MVTLSPLRSLRALLLLPLLVVLALVSTSYALSATGDRVLVVLDSTAPREEYSSFWSDLESRGFNLSFRSAKEAQPELTSYDEHQFDHVILFAPTAKALPSDLSPQALVSFLRSGGNALIGLSSSLSETYRDFAREFSLEFEDRQSGLIDHFRSPRSPSGLDHGNHTAVLVGPSARSPTTGLSQGGLVQNEAVFSDETIRAASEAPILYRGVAHRVGAVPLGFPLLRAPATSYSAEAPQIVRGSADAKASEPAEPRTETRTRTVRRRKVVPADAEEGEDSEEYEEVEETYLVTLPAAPAPSSASGPQWRAEGLASLEPLDAQNELLAGGTDSILVSGFQLLHNSARVLWVGGIEMFADRFVGAKDLQAIDGSSYPHTANKAVIRDLTSWTFQEKSVLRVGGTSHERIKAHPNDVREDYEEGLEEGAGKMYRVKDDILFTIDLAEHTPSGWRPARRDLDLQVSFVMLDPYITVPLLAQAPSSSSKTSNTTRYAAQLRAPDRHGVFSFHIDWKRAGWTYLTSRDTAPVRPFNHDEHPRFLSAAWPYYAGAASMAVGFLGFSTLWLLVKDEKPKSKTL